MSDEVLASTHKDTLYVVKLLIKNISIIFLAHPKSPGRNVERLGKRSTNINEQIKAAKKGIFPLNIVSTVSPEIPAMVNNCIPMGGVIVPIIEHIVIMTAE